MIKIAQSLKIYERKGSAFISYGIRLSVHPIEFDDVFYDEGMQGGSIWWAPMEPELGFGYWLCFRKHADAVRFAHLLVGYPASRIPGADC